ncbi:lipoprotein-releasing ABC transporter permease subunit [[Haemophilus] felis]|nr:lipoprotein-releasing ABC transporter permease subunit [[Haemophilus] felis]
MGFSVPLFIATRYWRAKSTDRFGRLVTNLASIGIVLGVAALIVILSVMNGLERYQKQQVLKHIPHAIMMPAQGKINLQQETLSVPNFVVKSVPINQNQVILQTSAGVSAGSAIGIQQFSDDEMLLDFVQQDFDSLLPSGAFNLLVGQRLAASLNLQVGDKIRVMMTENSQYTPFGRVPMQRLFTVSGIYDGQSEAESYTVFAHIADLGRLMRIPAQQAQGYRLFLQDPFQITQLPDFFPSSKWQIVDWRKQKGEFFQAVRMEKNMMGLLISLLIIVAISNIVTSLSLMVVDKQGEIAILQTQGLNKIQISKIFMYQGSLVGIVGTFFGVFLGILCALNLDSLVSLVSPELYLPTLLETEQILFIIGFSLILSFISTIYPAYRAAKIEPAEALRYE